METQKIVFDLSGNNWQMEGIRPGEGVKLGFHELPFDITGDAFNWVYAKVPGDVYTDLWRAGALDDPHFGRNSLKAKWVPEKEWWYKRQFDVPDTMKGKRIQLVFDGVDYACDVWLNGEFLGTHEGMFSKFTFDVTNNISFEKLRFGTNVLMVRLHPAPRRYSQVAGRKPAWHGDYWVSLPPTGIWKPVYLEAMGEIKIKNTYIKTSKIEAGTAYLDVEVTLDNTSGKEQSITMAIAVKGENFKSKTYEVKSDIQPIKPGETTLNLSLPIDEAQLWWPWDLGEQNLYVAQIVIASESGEFQDSTETSLGIRELKMEMNPGFTKDEVENPWTVMINGQRHFMRSGTWGGPPDIFMGRAQEHKYRELIQMAKEANLNNLRIFGWHPTEIPLFYKLCNEAGITVWQDVLPIASLSLPEEPEFKEKVLDEAVAVVKDLRNHPCVVILEGGEEIFMTAANRPHNLKFMLDLGEAIAPYHDLQYIPASPLSDEVSIELGFKPNESYHANDLFYGEGEYTMEEYFPSLDFAVIPELAISSCPNVKSIKKFIPADEVWPPGPSWGHHWTDFDVLRTLNFEVVGDQSTHSLDAFVEATQVAQGVIFQYALEHFRHRKPKTSAVVICHYITFAPDMKWGIVDYYREKKLSFDHVRKAYQPLLISLKHDARRFLPGSTFAPEIWVVNDYYDAYENCTVEVTWLDNGKNPLKTDSFQLDTILPDSSKSFVELSYKVNGQLGERFYVELKLKDALGKVLSKNDYFFLIADPKKDRARIREIGQEAMETKQKYGWANYYRYFKGLGGESGVKDADEQMPFVEKFKSQ